MNWNVAPEAVDMSAAVESGIGASMAAKTAAGSAALVGVTPMAADADSAKFAAALSAAGASYLGVAAEHVGQRASFAGGQSLASGVYRLTEAERAILAAIPVP